MYDVRYTMYDVTRSERHRTSNIVHQNGFNKSLTVTIRHSRVSIVSDKIEKQRQKLNFLFQK